MSLILLIWWPLVGPGRHSHGSVELSLEQLPTQLNCEALQCCQAELGAALNSAQEPPTLNVAGQHRPLP